MNTTATLIKHIIKSRKSIFPADYTRTPIPEEIIEDILDIATYAPNHKKTKPWRLKAFRGEEKTALGAELQRLYKEHVPAEKFSEDTYNALAQKVAKPLPLPPNWKISYIWQRIRNVMEYFL